MKYFDYFWYRFKYRFGKSLPLKTPVDISLELASYCDMRCEYCYHADQKTLPFDRGFMMPEVGKKIIREGANLGVNSIKFNWKGESTLNPFFFLFTKLAKNYAIGSTYIDRLTNSNFKFPNDRDDIFDGLSNQTKVKISFDSFEKKVLEKQRRGANFELILSNIDKFYNYPKRKNTEIVIQSIRTKLNKDEDLLGKIKKRWPETTVSIRDVVEGRNNKDIDELVNKNRDINNRQSCLQAHVRLIFNWKGEAYPCCPDIKEHLMLGDINSQSIGEIFNSFESKSLRKELKSGVAFGRDPCKNCSSYESYRGHSPKWVS